MICVVIKGPSYFEAHHQIMKAMECADLVEFRLDGFETLDLARIRELKEKCLLPMIFTLRSKQQGGNYQVTEEQRLKDIENLAALQPQYLDLEYHVPLSFVEKVAARHPHVQRIVSYHNFTETLVDLDECLARMTQMPAHFYKIAMTAQNTVDALRLCCWARRIEGNVIAISMGPHGQISRILAPIIRSPITYAALSEEMQSAPGQLTAEMLLNRYHYSSLNVHTALYGLIGDPVHLSISDITHNALFHHLGLNAVYVKMVVKAEELKEFFRYAQQLPFKGISVTMPLKEAVMPYLQHIDREAQEIGAVNTLLFQKGIITGFNTDGIGALNAIEQLKPVRDQSIVLLGAGGAAKAIAYEAHRRGGRLTIINRDSEKAKQLASRFSCRADGLTEMKEYAKEGYDILINSIPLPMPVEESDILSETLVMDIKTRPKETPFLNAAQKKNCQLIYGYKMFIEQALGQYFHWFNGQLDLSKCRKILEEIAAKALVS